MARTEADLHDVAPSRGKRSGLVGLAILVVVAVAVAFGVVDWLNSDASSSVLSLNQLQALRLSGTWKNADGDEITFTNTVPAVGAETAQGGFTFSGAGNQFPYEQGSAPSSGTGFWSAGHVGGSPEGVELTFPAGQDPQAGGAIIVLVAVGDSSAPTLVCDTTGAEPDCTFTRQ